MGQLEGLYRSIDCYPVLHKLIWGHTSAALESWQVHYKAPYVAILQ